MAVSAGGTLADALDAGPVPLDGGLSNQLEAQGCDLSDALWSARLLADAPKQIEAAHLAYLRAGARVLITASYQATFEGFARYGIDRAGAEALLARSVRLARRAADTARRTGPGRESWVAASVGPYGAMLADGSEYRGRYGLGVRELERFHRPRVAALAAAGPDALALETVPDVDEAEALVRVAEETGVPYWLSYSVAGGRTRAGQPLEEAFAVAAKPRRRPRGRGQLLRPGGGAGSGGAGGRGDGPAVVYPNSGEGWDAGARRWTGRGTFDPGRVRGWARAGARLVGGCCRVGPEQVAELAGRLEA